MPVYLWLFTIYLKGGNTILIPCWSWEARRKDRQLDSYTCRSFPPGVYQSVLKWEEVQGVAITRERELTQEELDIINLEERLEEKRLEDEKA